MKVRKVPSLLGRSVSGQGCTLRCGARRIARSPDLKPANDEGRAKASLVLFLTPHLVLAPGRPRSLFGGAHISCEVGQIPLVRCGFEENGAFGVGARLPWLATRSASGARVEDVQDSVQYGARMSASHHGAGVIDDEISDRAKRVDGCRERPGPLWGGRARQCRKEISRKRVMRAGI